MNEQKYRWVLYLIVTTTVLTIVLQCYWNYKNYLLDKQNFVNQVQLSLDNALDTYYAELAESNNMTIIETDSIAFSHNFKELKTDSVIRDIKHELRSVDIKSISGYTQFTDSSNGYHFSNDKNHISKIKVIRGKKASDSIKLLKGITSIFISIKNDTLDFSKLNPLVKSELKRKQLNIDFVLKHFKNDSLYNVYNIENIKPNFLKAQSKSTFLKQNELLEIAYPNATHII